MKDHTLNNLIELVSERTGLCVRTEDYGMFCMKIQERLKLLGKIDPDNYHKMLASSSPESLSEWKELAPILTTGESYFFRNKEQIGLLKHRILPEIIENKRQNRQLRVWSAGCSTGEEPYSLAILIGELLPSVNDWQLLVLGTDINEKAIEKARKGIYTQWSFRMVPSGLKERYFTNRKDKWIIREPVRQMVTFDTCNLVEDAFPSILTDIHDMDMILCRNVFIYFTPATILWVVSKFADTLHEGGYLVTGYGELQNNMQQQFSRKMIDNQVVYQKKTVSEPLINIIPRNILTAGKLEPSEAESSTTLIQGISRKTAPIRNKTEIRKSSLRKSLSTERKRAISAREPHSPSSVSEAPAAEAENSAIFDTCLRAANSDADAGNYERAIQNCQKAMDLSPASPLPHFLLAQIDESRNLVGQAIDSLKKVLYLDPGFVPAYIELGQIYQRENDFRQAGKLLNAAQEILKDLPFETPVPPYTDMIAGELLQHVEKQMASIGR